MAQADQQIDNASFPAVRTDITDNLAALFSQSSGPSAPAVTVAYQPWIDTSSSPAVWKVRNGTNTGWITVGTIDTTGGTFAVGGITPISSGGTGATTAAAALAALLPSQTGNSGKALVTDGSLTSWGTAGTQLVLATAVSPLSGTSINYTGIPSWAKRITVVFNGLSTSGTSGLLLQLGTASGNENTSYISTSYAQTNVLTTSTAGFALNPSAVAATDIRYGTLTLNLLSGNTWMLSGTVSLGSGQASICSGSKSTASTLDRVRITTVNGTDTFDAGSINIMYEG